MSEKSNATYGPFRPGDYVRIKNNTLAWQIDSVDDEAGEAVLFSGNYGRRRLEKLANLVPWGSEFRG